ncbi:MAG: hypothetical protein IPK06_04460 [Ignavibacteriae bacterium]|nr:hypothetical protein [Ignavibacteriota bacterium]
MGLNKNNAVFLNILEKFKAEINNCHINNLIKKSIDGGEIVFGWIIWQNQHENFIEAMFHSVWNSRRNVLVDITPRIDEEKLFYLFQMKKKDCN